VSGNLKLHAADASPANEPFYRSEGKWRAIWLITRKQRVRFPPLQFFQDRSKGALIFNCFTFNFYLSGRFITVCGSII
jgi:hypothetical protein